MERDCFLSLKIGKKIIWKQVVTEHRKYEAFLKIVDLSVCEIFSDNIEPK